MLARHHHPNVYTEKVSPRGVQHVVSRKRPADSGGRRNTSRREREALVRVERSGVGSGRWRALVRAGIPTRQGRYASLRDRPAAGS